MEGKDNITIHKNNDGTIQVLDDMRPTSYASRIGIVLRKLPALTSKIKAAAYASEVGEAFRPVVHGKVVKTLYGLSIGYVIVDIAGRTYCVHDQGYDKMGFFMFDTTLWHLMASLVFPAVTIHTLVKYATKLTKKVTVNKKANAWIPAILALSSVPFIIHPIDVVTDVIMDKGVRPFYLDRIAKEANNLRH